MQLLQISDIDWSGIFAVKMSVIEIFIRGSVMFLAMFGLLRIFRRQAGTVGIADLLVIVIIADAAQNGMAGDSKSVTEAILLIATIVLWDWIFDWLGFHSSLMGKVFAPSPVEVVRNGRIIQSNLDSLMITKDEMMSQLRQQGVEKVEGLKRVCLEPNGRFSVIEKESSGKKRKGNESGTDAVH